MIAELLTRWATTPERIRVLNVTGALALLAGLLAFLMAVSTAVAPAVK